MLGLEPMRTFRILNGLFRPELWLTLKAIAEPVKWPPRGPFRAAWPVTVFYNLRELLILTTRWSVALLALGLS